MAELFASGRIIDLILRLVVLEVMALMGQSPTLQTLDRLETECYKCVWIKPILLDRLGRKHLEHQQASTPQAI